MRKKAPGDLAKRLRKLVKSWLAIANVASSNNASPASGYSPALNTRVNSPATLAPLPSSSPRLPTRKPLSPAVQHVRGRTASPAAATTGETAPAVSRLVSPLVRQAGGRQSPLPSNIRRISPSNYKPSTPRSAVSTPFSTTLSSRPGTPNGTKQLTDNGRSYTPTPTHPNNQLNATPNFDVTSRTHAGNKKRRRSDESNASDSSSIKKARPVVNGESTRVAERIKTPKVKTTAEIIKELQSNTNTPLRTSDTITKIVTNQIEKEEDDIHASVVPVSAMPRFRRKNGPAGLPDPPSTKSDLSKTKSDLVHRFLQQTVQLGNSRNSEESPFEQRAESAADSHSIDMSIDPYSLLPPLDYENMPWSDDDDSNDGVVRRNAITGEYPEGCEPSDSSSGHSPPQSCIDKVICDSWHGVNGTMNDVNSQFHPWTETFTIKQGEEEQSDVHVLLPYVDL